MSNTGLKLNPSKNKIPSTGKNMVERERLIHALNNHLNRINFIVAPAGFGKSTLIINWLQTQTKPYTWFSVDENDNEPKRFFSYLIQSFSKINPEITSEISGLLQNDMIPEWIDIINLLIYQLEENGDEMILVIDDFHLITQPVIAKAINYLFEHIPAFIHIVILSRQESVINTSRLRLKGALFELHENDLRFSEEETSMFLNQTMMLQLDRQFVQQLTQKTEGWIAGMQMAAISLQHTNDVGSFIENFKGTNKLVVDYLLEEVLAGQVDHVQQFLLITSVADKFNAELAEELTGLNNCSAIIASIENAQLFLVSLDDDRNWYRYHHLFRDLLRSRLEQTLPGKTDELNAKLSTWFEKKMEISEAISYALRLKNKTAALKMLDQHAQGYFMTHSDLSVFESYESRVADADKMAYPAILIAKAWRKFSKFDLEGIEALTHMASAVLKDAGYAKQKELEFANNIMAIKAISLRLSGKLKAAEKASKEALNKLPASDLTMRGVHTFNLSQIYTRTGNYEEADHYAAIAYHTNLNACNYYVISLMQAAKTFTLYERGKLDEAKSIADNALAFIREKQMESLPSNSKLYFTLSLLQYQLNQLEEAMNRAEKSVQAALRGNDILMICNAYLVKALVCCSLGNKNEAEKLVADVEAKLKTFPTQNLVEITSPLLLLVYLCLNRLDQLKEAYHRITFEKHDEYSMAKGYEAIFISEWLLRENRLDEAARIIAWIENQSVSPALTLFHLHFSLNRAIWFLKSGEFSQADTLFRYCIRQGLAAKTIRVFIDKKDGTDQLVSNMRQAGNLSDEEKNFLQLLDKQNIPHTHISFMPKFMQKLVEPLTDREQEVLFYIEKGLSNKQIADKMFVSVNTIKTHIKNLYGKLGCESRSGALETAKKTGILKITHPG